MSDIKDLIEKLNVHFEGTLSVSEDNRSIAASKGELIRLMQILKDEYKYIMLVDMTAVDYEGYFELVYNVMDIYARLASVKVRLEKDDAVMSSLTPVWKAADVQEREIYDLMGIVFSGHCNLKRILCKDDFEGHPLRKDFRLDIVNRF